MKKQLLLFILILLPMMACAEDFSVNGILYKILSYQDLTLAVAPVERGSLPYSGDIVIPSSVPYGNKTWTVIEIMDNAFGYNSNITSVKLPSTLKKIGNYAFPNCSNSAPIAIPEGVEYIGSYAFNGVNISGTLPASLLYLGEWAFSDGQMDRIVIPKHLKEIPVMAFADIEDAPVTFNDSVESIGISAFYGNLTFVNVIVPSSVKTMGASFQNCTNIETIQLPKGLTTLGTYQNLPKLHSINIPDSIQVIEPFAFANDVSLKEISWPKFLSSIGTRAFNGAGIKKVKFPDVLYTKYYPTNSWGDIIGPLEIRDNGKVSIGSEAFANCSGLDSIFINDVVSSIGSQAFYDSKNVKAVVTTRETPLSISQDVFSAETYLSATLYVPNGTAEKYRKSNGWSNFSSIVELSKSSFTISYIVDGEPYKTYNIEVGETIVPEPEPTKEGYTFSGWSEIPETMPAHDVTVTGLFTINKYKLTYMVDGEEYKSFDVKYGATITPEAEPTKEGYIFSGWSEIPKTMPAHDVLVIGSFTQSKSSVEIDGIYYNLNHEEKSAEVIGTSLRELVIPETIGYENRIYTVKSIRKEAFSDNSNLTSVTIPDSVTQIGEGAFRYCINLKNVTLSKSIESIQKYTFHWCYGLREINIPQNVKIIDDFAFCNCQSLAEIKIPNHVEIIGKSTFNGIINITSIEIPSSVISIGESAFGGCNNLTSVSLSEGLQVIDDTAFGNTAITSIVIPNSVVRIGVRAFAYCKQLKSISIGSSINEICERAFASIDKLTDVTIYAENVPETDKTAFENSYVDYVTLHVPYGSVDKYKAVGPWKDFKEIVVIENTQRTFILTYKVDGEVYKTYEVKVGEAITPEPEPTKEGYTFSGWSYIPKTMPANDVEVTGSFAVNKYSLIYKVNGEVYKEYEMGYGAEIIPEEEPTKEGWEFSGWSWIPKKMPAEDVIITGTFTQIVYDVDGKKYIINDDEATIVNGGYAEGEVVIGATVTINGKTYQVTVVGEGAFQSNNKITSVDIPDGIETIQANAFFKCGGINALKIGKSVKYIGSKAFSNIWISAVGRRASDNPLTIECHAESVPEADADCFVGTSIANAVLLVDDKLVESYKAVVPWCYFGKIKGFNEASGIKAVWVNEDGNAQIFSLDGKPLNELQKGVNVVRMSNGQVRKIVVK